MSFHTALVNCTSAPALELQEKTLEYSHDSRLQTGELQMNINHVPQTITMVTDGGGFPPLVALAYVLYTRHFFRSAVNACCGFPVKFGTSL